MPSVCKFHFISPKRLTLQFLAATSLILASPLSIAEESPGFSCSGTENCGELGTALGKVFLLLGAAYAPHYVNLMNQEDEDISGLMALSSGSEDLKEFSLDVSSPIANAKSLFLKTGLQFQYRGRELPFILRYGFGAEFKSDFNGYHYLISSLGLGLENVEDSDRVRTGPQGSVKYQYRPQDRWTYEAGLLGWYNETAAWRLFTGFQYRGRSVPVPMAVQVGYEENKLLQMHHYLITIGLII